jgi:S-adenosylmethionine/arginine decarboxylase-like enzyme
MTIKTLKAWGITTSIDIHNCNPDKIRNMDYIKQYVLDLCIIIDMKRFGETQIVHFGDNEQIAGYSMIQFIESSLISGHFVNSTNRAYIDIFSCKYYDAIEVQNFSQKYFEGLISKINVILRD